MTGYPTLVLFMLVATVIFLTIVLIVVIAANRKEVPTDPWHPPDYGSGYQPRDRDLAPLLAPGALGPDEHETFVRLRRALNDPRDYKRDLEKTELEHHELKAKFGALKSMLLEWHDECSRFAESCRDETATKECRDTADGVEYALASFDALIGKENCQP